MGRDTNFLAGLVLVALAGHAQALGGKVVTPSGVGVPSLTVQLQSSGASATTDQNGLYSFPVTSIAESIPARIRIEGGAVALQLAQASRVRVDVRDAQGVLEGDVLERVFPQGFTRLDALAGVRSQGLHFVRVQAGDEIRTYRVLQTGTASRVELAAAGRSQAIAATDSLIVKSGGTLVTKVGFPSGVSTVPDIVLVRRTIGGSVTANGQTVGSVTLALAPSTGASQTLAPTFAAGSWSITTPWAPHRPGVSWTGSVKILDASKAVLGTGTATFADNAEKVTFTTVSLTAATVPQPPAELKASIDWVWENRIKDPTEANALGFYNFLFDQIWAEKGNLYVCVRWESKTKVTAAQRAKFEPMVNRAINNWTRWLKSYDGWPYDTVNVKIVGWAVADAAYLDATGLTVPVYVNGGLESEGKSAPICPDACNRDRFHDRGKVTTTYPDCKSPDKPFDITLWGTDGFQGGAGGDWGSRTGASYILSVLDAQEPHIIEHEFGHAFSLPDFYEAADLPPGGLPTAIMRAGNSAVITDWDGWMLRRVWTEIKKAEPSRFP